MQLVKVAVDCTAGGASGDVDGMREPDPMCMHTTTDSSLQAFQNGSQ